MGKRIVSVIIIILALMFAVTSCAETPRQTAPVGVTDQEGEDKAENEPETEDVTETEPAKAPWKE